MYGRLTLFHLLVCIFLYIALRYNKLKNHTKVFRLLHSFNKTRASVLFLRFDILNYELQIVQEFQYSVVSARVGKYFNILPTLGNAIMVSLTFSQVNNIACAIYRKTLQWDTEFWLVPNS